MSEEKTSPSTPETPPSGSQRRRRRSWGSRLRLVALFVVVLLGVSELLVRWINPTPIVQVFRNFSGLNGQFVEDVPIWSGLSQNPLTNMGCVERHRKVGVEPYKVFFFGSSIFHGSGVEPGSAFSYLLQERFDKLSAEQGSRPVCLLNFAQPGYGHKNKFAEATRVVPSLRPDLIFWEIWINDTVTHMVYADTVYEISHLNVGPERIPRIAGLPPALNGWMLRNSRLYEHLAILVSAIGSRNMELVWKRLIRDDLVGVKTMADDAGAELHFVLCPRLDRPFEQSAREWLTGYQKVVRYSDENGIKNHRLSELLSGEDYLALRNDPCCHYSVEGHKRLEDLFFEWISDGLESAKPRKPSP